MEFDKHLFGISRERMASLIRLETVSSKKGISRRVPYFLIRFPYTL